MYYTYVLQSENDGDFYTGFTKNLKLRFDQHNKGYVESTKKEGPLNLFIKKLALIKMTLPGGRNI